MTRLNGNAKFLRAALWYASGGFAVLPLRERSKQPLVSGGFKVASRDPATIRDWWQRWPAANVGIATGLPSALVVLDIDPRNGGDDSYCELREKFRHGPETSIVHTGSGGAHEYFRHPGAGLIHCRSHLAGFRGIDVKADGGYVVAPPSIHPNGLEYRWDTTYCLESFAPAPTPGWLLELAAEGVGSTRIDYDPEPWDGALPDRVAYAVARSRKVARRFQRASDGLAAQNGRPR